MNIAELQKLIDTATVAIADAMQKAESDADKKVADLALMGISVVGELLVDIKRIADASERQNEIQSARFNFQEESPRRRK